MKGKNFCNCFVLMPTRWPSKDETITEIFPFHTRGGPLLKRNSEATLESSFAKKVPSREGYLLHPSQLRWEGLRPLRDGGGVGLYHPTHGGIEPPWCHPWMDTGWRNAVGLNHRKTLQTTQLNRIAYDGDTKRNEVERVSVLLSWYYWMHMK